MEHINQELEKILSLVDADKMAFFDLLYKEKECTSEYRCAVYSLESLYTSINSERFDNSFKDYFEEDFTERVERLHKAESALKEVREQIHAWILEK